MTYSRICLVAACGLVLGAARADSQPAPPRTPAPRSTMRLSPGERSAALTSIKAMFQTSYVFPALRPAIIAQLERGQRAGRYNVDDPLEFAERITDDLRSVSHDRHLALLVDPAGYAAASAPPRSDLGEAAFTRRQAIRDHHGLAELKRLAGNVRYLRISGFAWVADETGAAYDDAMRFLRDGDAVIIDLRGNGGGDHAAVRYLISHFMDPDVLEMTFLEGANSSQSRTLEYLPAGRLKGKPLYVLIDGGTGSAAEALAYDVEQFKLGELVGGKTAGAANNNRLLPVAPGFLLSVSFGRPVHAISKTNWDGAGIKPTVDAAPAQALDVAHSLALSRIAQAAGASPETVAEVTWARTAVEARLHPPALSPAQLSALAGRYDDAELSVRDGALWLQRPARPLQRLTPLTTDGLFAVEPSELLRARITGNTLELLWPGAPSRVFTRR